MLIVDADVHLGNDIAQLNTVFVAEECVVGLEDLIRRYGPDMCAAAVRLGWVRPLPVWHLAGMDDAKNDHIMGLLALPG